MNSFYEIGMLARVRQQDLERELQHRALLAEVLPRRRHESVLHRIVQLMAAYRRRGNPARATRTA